MKYRLLKFIDQIIGHAWGEWGTFHAYKKGGGFITITARNHRDCERCGHREYRDWSVEEQKQLKNNYKHTSHILGKGIFGTMSGSRFINVDKIERTI